MYFSLFSLSVLSKIQVLTRLQKLIPQSLFSKVHNPQYRTRAPWRESVCEFVANSLAFTLLAFVSLDDLLDVKDFCNL